MEQLKKNWGLIAVAGVSVMLGILVLVSVARIGREQPVAPTAPTKQLAVEGSPVPQCVITFAITLPSATPTPSPTLVPTPTASPTLVPTPRPTATPTPTASPTLVPTPRPTATPAPTPSPTLVPTPRPTATPVPTPSASASPSPSASPITFCQEILVYKVNGDGSWTNVTLNLSSLRPGDTIVFAVRGFTNMSTFTKARFQVTVNGIVGNWVESTTLDPNDSRYFIYQYTILPGTTTISVGAEVFNVGSGTWY